MMNRSEAASLQACSPPAAYLECGTAFVATEGRPLLRWVGERSCSRTAGRATGGHAAAAMWRRVESDSKLRDEVGALVIEAVGDDATPQQMRYVRRAALARRKTDRCILTPGTARYRVLRAVADNLCALDTVQCWAWCGSHLARTPRGCPL